MESAIRFSQNSIPSRDNQRFLKVDVAGKVFSLCQITRESSRHASYNTFQASSKVPAFRAFDWHPTEETLVAVGSAGGETTLLNIAEGQQDSISFHARSQRPCNAVALSSRNLIAAGLDKVRTDFCLNVWDFNQRISVSGASASFSKTQTDPLYKLAGGEAIVSLKFFNSDPQLLMAGVKDKFVRLYDLREPNGNSGVQFATKCVSNLAIDGLDDNYFASCFPASEPIVCVWDRRMNARSGAASHGGYVQSTGQPEALLQFDRVTASPGTIWSLRYSKFKRGCLGVLASSGHLRVYETGRDFVANDYGVQDKSQEVDTQNQHRVNDLFLHRIQDVEQPFVQASAIPDKRQRVASFDFMTSGTRSWQPKIIVLTLDGTVQVRATKPDPEPVAVSSTGFFCKGLTFKPRQEPDLSTTDVSTLLNKIRRAAEPRNALKQAYKASKHDKVSPKERSNDIKRMSSFANHCWNTDLGYFEKKMSVEDLMVLLAGPRLRCESGYLLDTAKNKSLSSDSQWVESFWSWVERAEMIRQNNNMLQDNLDMSFAGVYSIWMEEVATGHRQTGASFAPMLLIIKKLATRLNLPPRKGVHTEYPWHRKLCLHVAGLGWSHEQLENIVQKLVSSNQHTKAAATAIFADEEKTAYKALRAKTASQSHKMLAMAVAGAKRRQPQTGTSTPSKSGSDTETDDDEWAQTIASLSSDLTDPYARAILAYVKSGSWLDVVNVEALPLKQRVGIALRHLSDSDLTEFIGRMTRQVIATGNIEGVILTGTSTREGLELLQTFSAIFNDLQTAILGLSVGGAAGAFIESQHEDKWSFRKLEGMREAYRSTIMSWGLKFDRVRFDVAYSNALLKASSASSRSATGPGMISSNDPAIKPKQQTRLVCTYCTQSLTQFPPDNGVDGAQGTKYTPKNPLTPERAAVLGTVCPKCGRHLPRCGVCDLWLGVPDESFAKQPHSTALNNNRTTITHGSTLGKQGVGALGTKYPGGSGARSRSVSATADNMTASMTASVITTIGPTTNDQPSKAKRGSSSGTTKSVADSRALLTQSLGLRDDTRGMRNGSLLPEEAVVVVDDYHNNSNGNETDKGNTIHAKSSNPGQVQTNEIEMERKWVEVMQKFIVFCVRCAHGFHAEHAKLWFEGMGGTQGHRICPVPGCGCTCNG